MIIFFDTSALVKRYVSETGSQKVDELFDVASQIIVSPITKIEIISCMKRLRNDTLISQEEYIYLKKEIDFDFKYFTVLSLGHSVEENAIVLIEKYQLKTLDSIQLASCISQKGIIDNFVASDTKLKRSALNENIRIIDPTEY